jgi:glycosyl transferase family 2
MSDQPELSVVIAVVSDAAHLKGCLQSLRNQQNAPHLEIIVPHDGDDPQFAHLAGEFPEVNFLPVENLQFEARNDGLSREHHDELRARGLQAAKGKILALIEDHGRADARWASNLVQLHHQSCAAIGGAMENEVDRPLNWAVYFSDFGRYQNPLPAGPSHFLTDANVSYKGKILEEIREIWQASFHETTVHSHLLEKGETLWLAPEVIVFQHRENLTLSRALKERYVWGRSFAGTRALHSSVSQRLVLLAFSPLLPILLLARRTRAIVQKKRLLPEFMKCFPYLTLLTIFWSFGEFVGYWTGKPVSGK